jgi:excinuclease ABC subunit C
MEHSRSNKIEFPFLAVYTKGNCFIKQPMHTERKIKPVSTGLQHKVSAASSGPGVYLMKDADGKVIYVGKARNLKKRLSAYFGDTDQMSMKTQILVKKISVFETIVTGTEKEALILESNLIKRFRPRYNVILKDDKRYPSLRLDIKSPYPNLCIVRKTENDGALYFGPFASSQAVRETLKILYQTFKLRRCKTKNFKNRTRPCLNYQMGFCLAPCCLEVNKAEYNEMIKEAVLFLKGRTPELIQKIKRNMMVAAKARDYEKAAVLRDKMFALEKTLEKQVSITTDFRDRDVIGIARSDEVSLIILLFVRGGYLLGTRHFSFAETMSTDSEMIGTFIGQYYEKAHFVPQEVLVPVLPEDATVLEEWLKNIKGTKVNIVQPKRSEKMRLIEMANHNAENKLGDLITSKAANSDILLRLQKQLKMDKTPVRIECLDNSNISGTEPVAAVVAFVDGKPDKASYRKYKIKTVTRHNDYAYMAEVLKRRFGKGEQSKPYPDLLMVDGGKGQLNIAVSVMKDLNLEGNFKVIGIAKKDEKRGETQDKIYERGRANPVNMGKERDLLLFLQRIRDEAHRFAIVFHRKRRTGSSMHSILDTIPGIGKKKKTMLLKHFGSIKKIREATIEELRVLPGMNQKLAESIRNVLSS